MSAPLDTVDPGVGRRAALAEAALIWNGLFRNRLRIAFPEPKTPLVSVVTVSRDAPDLLALTLYRLAAQAAFAGASFELILVDNASGPETQGLLDRLDGAVVVRNAANTGFGPACNAGAALARGRYLLFLNPDVDLMPGAIGAMVETFSEFEEAGIVGARLVFPGGYLQESGAGFRDDAQLTHPYGRGLADPFSPEHAVAREVGYVSGAVLMIERALFEAEGGFDPLFAPAYFEDTDLCLRVRQRGRRVIVQPRASAIHYEHATSPRHEEVRALLDRHRGRFLDRHRDWLFGQTSQADDRADDPWRLRVLCVDDRVPHLDLGAGLPRTNAILNAMAAMGYAVTFFPVYGGDAQEARRYRDLDGRIEILAADGDDGFRRLIAERRDRFDVLWVSRAHNVKFVTGHLLDAGSSPRAFARSRVIFDSEALFALRDFVTTASARGTAVSADLARAAGIEARGFAAADAVVCVSAAEARVLARYSACTTAVLGHALPLPETDPPGVEGRDGFLFLGALAAEGQPNVDSLDWFLAEVWPGLRRRLPNAHLTLIGEIADSVRVRFTRETVRILGRLDEIGPCFDAARVCVAPTRFAAGIPLKVYESVARGLPTVVTPILAEQTGWPEGDGILTRDWRDPEAFADALAALHRDDDLWRSVQASGLARVRAECDPGTYAETIRALCEGEGVA